MAIHRLETGYALNMMPEEARGFAADVLKGLSLPQKSLPPRWLYDERGSRLFELICECPEYYVTRTEVSILKAHAPEIARRLGRRPVIFEPGSGAGLKTRILLDASDAAAYVPIEISRSALSDCVRRLRHHYPELCIIPACADFTDRWPVAESEIPAESGRRVVFFPGSTIGNFEPDEAIAFLRHTARFLGPGGLLLLGIDLLKPKAVLEAAYDDRSGVTAAFNLNLLRRMQSELGARLDSSFFRHLAFFDEKLQRVEMHLVSLRAQRIEVLGRGFALEQGETIHTECSYKYAPSQLETLASLAGMSRKKTWTDRQGYFAVALFEV